MCGIISQTSDVNKKSSPKTEANPIENGIIPTIPTPQQQQFAELKPKPVKLSNYKTLKTWSPDNRSDSLGMHILVPPYSSKKDVIELAKYIRTNLDKSSLIAYIFDSEVAYKHWLSDDEKYDRDVAIEDAPEGYKFNETMGLELLKEGKFSCLKCFSRYTDCERNIGCAVMIIIFISFGIGLIMVPFLPYKCECLICKHRWKS